MFSGFATGIRRARVVDAITVWRTNRGLTVARQATTHYL